MKKFFTLIALFLVLTMMPFALFSCNEKLNNPKHSQSDEIEDEEKDSSGKHTNKGDNKGTDTTDNTEDTDNTKDTDDIKDTADGTQDENTGDGVQDENTDSSDDDVKDEGKDDGKNDEEKPTVVKLSRHSDKVKALGRTQVLNTGLACDHTASGIELRGSFEGDVKIKVRTLMVKMSCEKTYFTVYVDGVRQGDRVAMDTPAIKTLTLASFDKKGEHTIRIVKQTENNYTLVEFIELNFKGELLAPPENNDTYIEFIGDSLTCGMGNIPGADKKYPSDSNIAQTSHYEDGSRSYGYIAADMLGADYSIVSESGIGLSATWDDPMPAFYTQLSYNRSQAQKYDFKRVPNLVVINLGTNDYYINSDTTLPQSPNATPEKFKIKVKDFIQTVRTSYGKDVPIVWVSRFVGIGNDHVAAIDSAISELGGESAGLYRLDVTRNTSGAQGHPTVAGHEKAANELVSYILSKNLLPGKSYNTSNVVKLSKNSSQVRHLGRTQTLSTGIAVDHTASGIEFKGIFNGDVKIKIKSDSSPAPYDKGISSSYFTVYVDGVRQSKRFEAPEGTSELTVATFTTAGAHTIKIVKQTENNYTLCDFIELSFKGELATPPAEKDILIEFVGDSITCGVGNVPNSDGSHPTGGGSAQKSKYEDGTKTYAYLTSEALGTDSTMVSEAAMGISATWYDPFFDYYEAISYNRNTSAKYDFSSARVPDILVINQGTNDSGFGGSGFSDPGNAWYQQHLNAQPENFKKCIKDFIAFAREVYGEDLPIVWVKNSIPISATYTNAIVEALNELGGESAGIYICTVTANNKGGEGHPTAEAHQVMANELVSFMKNKGLVPN